MKVSQIYTENDKKPIFFQFSKVLRIFVKVSTHFVDWNVLKGNKENMVVQYLFYEEIVAMI